MIMGLNFNREVLLLKIRQLIYRNQKENIDNTYHYTSPEGMLSILQNRTLRFTDCQFFNDKLEYIYIKKPLCKVVNELAPKMRNQHLVESVDLWFKDDYEVYVKERHLKERYYVFCTSTDNDSLNMWNYYIKNGKYQGYNIGISLRNIIENLESLEYDDYEMWYGPVVYNICEQEEMIFELIRMLDEKLWEIKQEVNFDDYWNIYLQEAQEEIINTIELYRLFFKDSAFRNEKEYRFVLKIPMDIEETLDFVPGYQIKEGIISPYIDIKFCEEILENITLSPMIEKEIAMKGLELFMYKAKYSRNIKFNVSDILIR